MRSWSYCSLLVLALLVLGCCGRKDGTSGADQRHEAPRHGAPDQQALDSLKQEKLKDKH